MSSPTKIYLIMRTKQYQLWESFGYLTKTNSALKSRRLILTPKMSPNVSSLQKQPSSSIQLAGCLQSSSDQKSYKKSLDITDRLGRKNTQWTCRYLVRFQDGVVGDYINKNSSMVGQDHNGTCTALAMPPKELMPQLFMQFLRQKRVYQDYSLPSQESRQPKLSACLD